MTEFAAVHTTAREASAAGRDLAAQIQATMDGKPDVLLVFASSAGEFTHGTAGVGTASALAIRSSDLKFAVGIGHGVSRDGRTAAR